MAEILAPATGFSCPADSAPGGIEGKVCAARHARENRIPYFGICLGMQIAVMEFARHVGRMEGASSSEFDADTPYPVIYLMTEWYDAKTDTVHRRDEGSEKGATMRLGAYPCRLKENTLARAAYEKEDISERHRHRFEFNNAFKAQLEESGLVISGVSPDGELVEIVEIPDHPWFLGCQFHPEFKSRPRAPPSAFPRIHSRFSGEPRLTAVIDQRKNRSLSGRFFLFRGRFTGFSLSVFLLDAGDDELGDLFR